MKITTKTWLGKVAATFPHRSSRLQGISVPVSFYSKCMFLVSVYL